MDRTWRQSQASCTWLSCIWREFQACHTLQDNTDDSSIDKLATSLEYRSISLSSKIRLMCSLITSIFLYACESWTITAELQRRIQALGISYEDQVTNKDVCAKIQRAIGSHEDLLTIIKRHKLKWYGQFSRSSHLAKTILQGTVKGGRRQGRQKKSWEDNIREWTHWTGPEFPKSQRAVETKKNGGNSLWSHLWCPNDPHG